MLGKEDKVLVLGKKPQLGKLDKQEEQLQILIYISLLVQEVFDLQEFLEALCCNNCFHIRC
jgi:hypothetical protein